MLTRSKSGRILLLAGMLLPLVGCGPTSFLITPVPAQRELDETIVIRESFWTARRIALVDVDGLLHNSREDTLTGVPQENPVALFKEKLDKAANDPRVKAIVLRINSPGGTVTASNLMYHEVMRVREQTDKPIVAVILDTGASGGYYLACAAEHIVVHPTSITGSIGVIMMLPNVAGTLDRIGAVVNAIKSGEYKDTGSPFRPMDAEDRELLQHLVDDMYAQFLAVVREGRPELSDAQLKEVADGRILLGPDAVEAGLADEVGTIRSALVSAKQLAGLEDKPVLVVQYARPLYHRPNVYATPPHNPATAAWPVTLPPWLSHSTPQMLYLWAPGW